MKSIPNLITILSDNVHSEDIPRNLKYLINALTGQACSSLMSHIYAVRRGEVVEPTLDARNEQDADIRGRELNDEHVNEIGFVAPMAHLKIAQICDGLRHTLYQELHRYGDYLDEQHLYVEPALSASSLRTNYDQPMSAELYMNLRVQLAGTVNEADVQRGAKSFNKTVDLIREIMTEDATKQKARLLNLKPEVLSELQSFNDSYDIDVFPSLPLEVQQTVGNKVYDKLKAEYARMLPRALRSNDKLMISQLAMIEATQNALVEWITNVDPEVKAAKALAGKLAVAVAEPI